MFTNGGDEKKILHGNTPTKKEWRFLTGIGWRWCSGFLTGFLTSNLVFQQVFLLQPFVTTTFLLRSYPVSDHEVRLNRSAKRSKEVSSKLIRLIICNCYLWIKRGSLIWRMTEFLAGGVLRREVEVDELKWRNYSGVYTRIQGYVGEMFFLFFSHVSEASGIFDYCFRATRRHAGLFMVPAAVLLEDQ